MLTQTWAHKCTLPSICHTRGMAHSDSSNINYKRCIWKLLKKKNKKNIILTSSWKGLALFCFSSTPWAVEIKTPQLFIRHLYRKAHCLSLRISLSESNNPKHTVLKLTLTVDVFVKLKSLYEVGPSDSFRRHYWKRTKKKSQKDTNTRFVHNERLHALRLQPLKWSMSNIIWINTGLVCGMALSESFSRQVEISSKVRL